MKEIEKLYSEIRKSGIRKNCKELKKCSKQLIGLHVNNQQACILLHSTET